MSTIFIKILACFLLANQGVGNILPKATPKNCLEIQTTAQNPSDLDSTVPYDIYPLGPNGGAVNVRCDFETNGGGWTILQQRFTGPKYEFFKDWVDYEAGFGSTLTNYWIGLKYIYALTSPQEGVPQQELRVDLGDWEGLMAFASYKSFSISNSSDFYRLAIADYYDGKAWDSLTEFTQGVTHNGMQFSTRDKDNDQSGTTHCAKFGEGAWWFNECSYSDLNGVYLDYDEHLNWGMRWGSWRDPRYSLKNSTMKIRDFVNNFN